MFETTFLRSALTSEENARRAAQEINSYGYRNQVSFGAQPGASMWARVRVLEAGYAKVSVELIHPDFEEVASRILDQHVEGWN